VLVAAGLGQVGIDQVEAFLTERSDLPARLTAPASGLFLERVYYEGDRRDLPVRSPVRVLRP
jgi:tRNA pseudouridine38-40 synthase